jgi:hypothetical protein
MFADRVSKTLYTCGMHPQIISEEPGDCPIYGMKLTPKRDMGSEGEDINGVNTKIDPVTQQNMRYRRMHPLSSPGHRHRYSARRLENHI